MLIKVETNLKYFTNLKISSNWMGIYQLKLTLIFSNKRRGSCRDCIRVRYDPLTRPHTTPTLGITNGCIHGTPVSE